MRFRVGLTIGFGAGYVLGSRAGRQRYEQIARTARKAWESETAAKLRAEMTEALPSAVSTAVEKVGELRHRNGDEAQEIRAAKLPA
jgi:hypothetical protein